MDISDYTVADNEEALDLDARCIQGESIRLKYRRPTFHARSGVYGNPRILCARSNGRLVGITAWAEKKVRLHGDWIRAAYAYDLRVHPDSRSQGVASRLVRAMYAEIGDVDCVYMLAAGENRGALAVVRSVLGLTVTIPCTYAILPVYKRSRTAGEIRPRDGALVRESHLRTHVRPDFVPEYEPDRMTGHVAGLALEAPDRGGCSLWTNENLLAEEVVSVPGSLRMMRTLSRPLRPFVALPHIPKPGEVVASWFIYDLYAGRDEDFFSLLAALNNMALEAGRDFLYALLPADDRYWRLIRKSGHRCHAFPYCFVARGRHAPAATDRIYLDVRDL